MPLAGCRYIGSEVGPSHWVSWRLPGSRGTGGEIWGKTLATLVVKLDLWNIKSMDKYGWIWIGMVGWTIMKLHKDLKIRVGTEMIFQVMGLEAVRRNCPSTVPERFIWICYEPWVDALQACGLNMHEAGHGCKILKGMDVKWRKQIVYKQ